MSVANSVVDSTERQIASPGVAVTHCAEGHPLVQHSADAGRCEGCQRWVFGRETVMSCTCCSCYYCSTCSPQVRSNADENLWEDILSTLGSALRDVERIKNQVTNEVDFDLDRIRSAFNCQAPGNETLSAEQIVVEHAYEQAKSVLGTCGAPMDLDSQEEVIEPRDQFHAPGGGVDTPGNTPRQSESEAPPVVEQKAPTDLLDLSISAPMEVMNPTTLSPVKASADEPATLNFGNPPETQKAPTADLLDLSLLDDDDEVPEMAVAATKSPTKAPIVDLMDLSDDVPVSQGYEVPEVAIAATIKSPEKAAPLMDLADLSDLTVTQGEAAAVETKPQDLLDLAAQSATSPATETDTSGIPVSQQTNLQDIVDVKVAPASAPAVHDLADLLDFHPQTA